MMCILNDNSAPELCALRTIHTRIALYTGFKASINTHTHTLVNMLLLLVNTRPLCAQYTQHEQFKYQLFAFRFSYVQVNTQQHTAYQVCTHTHTSTHQLNNTLESCAYMANHCAHTYNHMHRPIKHTKNTPPHTKHTTTHHAPHHCSYFHMHSFPHNNQVAFNLGGGVRAG